MRRQQWGKNSDSDLHRLCWKASLWTRYFVSSEEKQLYHVMWYIWTFNFCFQPPLLNPFLTPLKAHMKGKSRREDKHLLISKQAAWKNALSFQNVYSWRYHHFALCDGNKKTCLVFSSVTPMLIRCFHVILILLGNDSQPPISGIKKSKCLCFLQIHY